MTAIPRHVRARTRPVLFCHLSLPLRVAPSRPHILAVCWNTTPLTASSEEAPAPYRRAWSLINCSQWWVAGTGKNNRCQSSLNEICHLSKFQITPQLKRKMKTRMHLEFDILINYFLHMKNWLILHVTLEPSCVFWITQLAEKDKKISFKNVLTTSKAVK